VRDLDLLGALVLVGAADPAGVEQVDLERRVLEQLEQPVGLGGVVLEPERVGAGHAQVLAGLGGATGRGALGLTQHEVVGGLLGLELGHRRDDVLVAVEDEQVLGLGQVARVAVADVLQREGAAPVGRVVGVEEVDLAGLVVHRDVLEPGVGGGRTAVDGGLVVGVEAEGLGEAAVLGGVHLAAGHQGDEVVLDRQRALDVAERGGGLAGAGQPDDQREVLLTVGGLLGGEGLRAGVHRQPAALVDQLVPHPQAPHLRLAEVVGAEDPGGPGVEVDRDQAVIGHPGRGQVGRVDDRELGRVVVVLVEVQLLLHGGDVGVGLLHEQPRPGAELGVGADVALDQDHVLLGDVGVLLGRPLLGLGGRDRGLGVGLVADEEGRLRKAGDDPGLIVDVAELGLGDPIRGHELQHPCAQLVLRGVDRHGLGFRQLEAHVPLLDARTARRPPGPVAGRRGTLPQGLTGPPTVGQGPRGRSPGSARAPDRPG
jgi:hypothetical protein